MILHRYLQIHSIASIFIQSCAWIMNQQFQKNNGFKLLLFQSKKIQKSSWKIFFCVSNENHTFSDILLMNNNFSQLFHMKTLFFDIETISIFWKDHRESTEQPNLHADLRQKHWDRFDFMPEFNKILTICCWVYKEDEVYINNLEWSEEDMIKKFFELSAWKELVWFNIKGFDLPFIVKRALHHKIAIPNHLRMYWKKVWDMVYITDLYAEYKHMWFNSASLDVVCQFLWIESSKDWIDGSQVQRFHDEWRDSEIIEYCKRDVAATIKVFEYFKEYNFI